MKKRDPMFHTFFWRRYCKMLLAFCWCIGLLSGQLLLLAADQSALTLFCRASSEMASGAGLLISALLPLVLSAFFLIAFRPFCLVFFCYFQALLYSFVILGISMQSGSGGWLFRFLFLSRNLSITLEYWFWQHYLSGEHRFSFPVLFLLIAIALLGVGIENSIFFPFREFFIV